MRSRLPVLILLTVCIIARSVQGQAAPSAPARHGGDPVVIPEIDVHDFTIEDLVNLLRDKDPNFKVLVTRTDPNSADPRITLRVKNVTPPDVLAMLASAYPVVNFSVANGVVWPPPATEVHLDTLQSDHGGALYTLKITPPTSPLPTPPGETPSVPPAAPAVVVQVYNLRPAAMALLDSNAAIEPATRPSEVGDRYKKCQADVLALLKAVLDMSQGPGGPAQMEVHEATGTLIVRGAPEQQGAVEQALRTVLSNNAAMPPSSFGRPSVNPQ